MTKSSFYIRIDTLSYSLKGERGAPGPKGMSAPVKTSQICLVMMSLIKTTLPFQVILDLWDRKVREIWV